MRWKIKPISKSISDLENKFSPTLLSTDANNAITSGLYYLTGDCANRPADWCTMTVVAYDNDTLSQTATSVITGKTYVRAKSVNGWTSWEELALNSNLLKRIIGFKPTGTVTTDSYGMAQISTGLDLTNKRVCAVSNFPDNIQTQYGVYIQSANPDGTVKIRVRNLSDGAAIANTAIDTTNIILLIMG